MENNNGINNELEIVHLLHGKSFKDIPKMWQDMIKDIYPEAKDDDRVFAKKAHIHEKADIFIGINNKMRSVSIKSGDCFSVHSEWLRSWCGFLKWLGISDKSINTLLLYHFGDGTIDGTGSVRYGVAELKQMYKSEIEEFNKEVNDEKYLYKIFDRCLRIGTPHQRSFVYKLYYGTKDEGFMLNMRDVIILLQQIKYDDITSLHFGPFIYSPGYRGLSDFKSDNPKRFTVDIKWPRGRTDLKRYYDILENNKKSN